MGLVRLCRWGLVLALVLSAGVVVAQGGIRLTYNSTVQGTISASQYTVTYEFEAQAGDVIAIELSTVSGDLDPLVELADDSGIVLASNDDLGGGSRNSRIDDYTLAVGGLYTIRATRFNGANGITTGAYALTLTLLNSAGQGTGLPTLSVTYERIGYNQTVSGQLDGSGPRYYVFSAESGDVVVAMLRPTETGVVPVVRFLDTTLAEISPSVAQNDGSAAAYLAVTVPGWYLIGVDSAGSAGTYSLETIGFPAQWIAYGDSVAGEVRSDAPSKWYVFQARYGDTVTVQMTATGGDLQPYVILADKGLNDLAYSAVGQNPTLLTYTIPRSDIYVLLASREDLNSGTTTGPFSLAFNATPLDPATLNAQPLGYGLSVQETVSDDRPVVFFSFQGKAGDLVTISMTANELATIDPYLILTDSSFTELAFSDNTGTSNDARIFQYRLPAGGLYYIMATRPDMGLGEGSGSFTLELLAGEVALTAGAVEATVRWNSTADVDLFVRDPNGDYVAWDVPVSPSGGILEVDTNANCESLTALPVEHTYWPEGTNLPGVYEISVWYQLDCQNTGPVTFDLSVSVGGQEIARANQVLERGQRYEMSITVGADGSAYSNNDGVTTTPATNANVTPIAYGESVTGTITNDVPLVYYIFSGQAGQSIVVTMERLDGDLDPYAGLLNASRAVLAEDDDSGGNRDARFTFTLPETGTYYLVATRYQITNGTTTGQYRLSLNRSN